MCIFWTTAISPEKAFCYDSPQLGRKQTSLSTQLVKLVVPTTRLVLASAWSEWRIQLHGAFFWGSFGLFRVNGHVRWTDGRLISKTCYVRIMPWLASCQGSSAWSNQKLASHNFTLCRDDPRDISSPRFLSIPDGKWSHRLFHRN